jgi:hypothetical protein
MLLISRHGKVRVNKFYKPLSTKERNRIIKDVSNTFPLPETYSYSLRFAAWPLAGHLSSVISRNTRTSDLSPSDTQVCTLQWE